VALRYYFISSFHTAAAAATTPAVEEQKLNVKYHDCLITFFETKKGFLSSFIACTV